MRILALSIAWAFCMWAADNSEPDRMIAWYNDGTSLEVSSDTSTHTALPKSIALAWKDRIYRIVLDAQDRILFAYQVEGHRVEDGVFVGIYPVGAEFDEALRGSGRRLHNLVAEGRYPTVSAPREFAFVRRDEAVTLEI